jgi:hypothetical protein
VAYKIVISLYANYIINQVCYMSILDALTAKASYTCMESEDSFEFLFLTLVYRLAKYSLTTVLRYV